MENTVSIDSLRGKDVLTKDGRHLGVMVGAQLDPDGWHVPAIDVRLDREVLTDFGMTRKVFGTRVIGILTAHIASASDALILNTTLAELEASGPTGQSATHSERTEET